MALVPRGEVWDSAVKDLLEGAAMTCRLSAKSYFRTLFSLIFSAAFSLLLTGGAVHAQIATASLNGTITDPSGALIPGAMVSGKVTFSDGVKAAWHLDQAGRLGLAPTQPGYRPSAADLQEFQMALEQQLAKMGM